MTDDKEGRIPLKPDIHPVDVLLDLAKSRARAEFRNVDMASFERLRKLCDEPEIPPNDWAPPSHDNPMTMEHDDPK